MIIPVNGGRSTSDTPLTSLSPPAYLTRLPHASSDPLLASSWTLGAFGTVGKIKSRFGQKTTYFGVQVFGTMVPEEKYYVGPARTKGRVRLSCLGDPHQASIKTF